MIKAAIGWGQSSYFLASPATLNLFDNPEIGVWKFSYDIN